MIPATNICLASGKNRKDFHGLASQSRPKSSVVHLLHLSLRSFSKYCFH